MKTRSNDPDFPMDLALHFMALPSILAVTILLDIGLLRLSTYWLGVAFVCIGAVQMFRAKLPLYRQGRFFTFGPRAMAAPSRIVYFSSLRWIASGLTVTSILWLTRFGF